MLSAYSFKSGLNGPLKKYLAPYGLGKFQYIVAIKNARARTTGV
jgi:hypothetical protein